MNVLVLDGPLRGKLMTVDSNRFVVTVSHPIDISRYWATEGDYWETVQPNFDYITYYVHKFLFIDKVILVASKYPVKPRDSAAFSLILTRKAKAAMI